MLRQAEGFGEERMAVLPGSSRSYFVATAAPGAAPAPALEALADNQVNGERVVQLQLQSPRGGDWLALYIPQAARLKRLEVLGTPYTLQPEINEDGYQTFECYGPACAGLKLALHRGSSDPFEVFLVDDTCQHCRWSEPG